MLSNEVVDRIIRKEDTITLDPSRCLPMRFNGNTCDRCMACCLTNAITLKPSLSLNNELCTGCMRCTSVCPSEALAANALNFFSTLARLKQVHKPVLSCNRQPDLQAHEKTGCLGWLGEEYLIALLVNLQSILQLNLTICSDCQNGFIVDELKKNLKSVAAKTGLNGSQKILLVEDRSELDYQETSHDRRSFFGALKKRVAQEAVNIIDPKSANKKHVYSQKKIPVKRKVLNAVLSGSSGKIRENLLTNYYYAIFIEEFCDLCFACVAMCPTGALHVDKNNVEDRLLFDSYRCNGCELCTEFCVKDALQVKQGCSESSRIKAMI